MSAMHFFRGDQTSSKCMGILRHVPLRKIVHEVWVGKNHDTNKGGPPKPVISGVYYIQPINGRKSIGLPGVIEILLIVFL